jgi:uncharacterized protein (TIGR02996 family)
MEKEPENMISEQLLVFLREIKDQPDDDTPRLILADWLQDQGEARGELIHLQVVRARIAEDDPRYNELYRRERQILARHAFHWLGPFIDVVGDWEFRRGLVFLEARAESLLGDSSADIDDEALLWVEELRILEAQTRHLTRLGNSPLLEHLANLDLSGNNIADNGLERLLASPYLDGLRVLRLSGNRIGGHGAATLARCPDLAGLHVLDLAGNRLGDAGARALAESPHLANLRKLVVSGNSINLDALSALREAFGPRLEITRLLH